MKYSIFGVVLNLCIITILLISFTTQAHTTNTVVYPMWREGVLALLICWYLYDLVMKVRTLIKELADNSPKILSRPETSNTTKHTTNEEKSEE